MHLEAGGSIRIAAWRGAERHPRCFSFSRAKKLTRLCLPVCDLSFYIDVGLEFDSFFRSERSLIGFDTELVHPVDLIVGKIKVQDRLRQGLRQPVLSSSENSVKLLDGGFWMNVCHRHLLPSYACYPGTNALACRAPCADGSRNLRRRKLGA